MVPKIHAKGCSFRGAAQYLLHDKGRATTNDRVDWTATHNLATDDADVAWRVMAATAMNSDRLKQQAGVKNTGRKSKDSVLHFTLSWHPDESEEITREEMLRAAKGALEAIGANDRQVLFVSHSDEPQTHIHCLVNRVSPTDGRMLPSSNERLNLSKWAQEYEQGRGQVFCEQRVINNAARDRGEYTRGEKDQARHIHEMEVANDNHPDFERVRREQRRLDAAQGAQTRKLAASHRGQWDELTQRHRGALATTRAQSEQKIEPAKNAVRERYRKQWTQRFHERQADLRDFERGEKTKLGRLRNALRAIDFKAIVAAGERRSALKDAFGVFASKGARMQARQAAQDGLDAALAHRQARDEKQASKSIRDDCDRRIGEQRALFHAERHSLIFKQSLEHSADRGAWKTRNKDRRQAYENLREQGVEKHRPTDPSGKQRFSADDAMKDAIEDFKRRSTNPDKARDNDRDQDGRER